LLMRNHLGTMVEKRLKAVEEVELEGPEGRVGSLLKVRSHCKLPRRRLVVLEHHKALESLVEAGPEATSHNRVVIGLAPELLILLLILASPIMLTHGPYPRLLDSGTISEQNDKQGKLYPLKTVSLTQGLWET
jgi:hypothetical protein